MPSHKFQDGLSVKKPIQSNGPDTVERGANVKSPIQQPPQANTTTANPAKPSSK
jgi:hypothetical protein